MTPSFWPLYHIPGLTGLSIKRTLGLILALSGKNTLKQSETQRQREHIEAQISYKSEFIFQLPSTFLPNVR